MAFGRAWCVRMKGARHGGDIRCGCPCAPRARSPSVGIGGTKNRISTHTLLLRSGSASRSHGPVADLEARYTQRLALCRRLYEEGFSQKDVVFIHGLIDRLMILPRPLMIRFRQELFTLEKDKNMPYVDTLTRMSLQEGRKVGRKEGRTEGRQEGSLAQARESVIEALEIRFGEISTDLRERINALDNLRTLKAQLRRAITVPSLDQF
jgi:hypothetical protein